MLRVGALHYLNSLPLFAALNTDDEDMLVRFAEPITNNESLRRGFLDVAVISSYDYLQHQDSYELLSTCCIASTGPVMSVCLFSKSPPEELDGAHIAVTGVSATSVELLKILCRHYWEVHPTFVSLETSKPLTSYDAFLLIGDTCLATSIPTGWHRIDLGAAWHDYTHLPFVYAVLAANKSSYREHRGAIERFSRLLHEALLWSEKEPSALLALATHLYPFSQDIIAPYFRCLTHRFSPELWQGLQHFHRLTVLEAPAAGARDHKISRPRL